MTALAWVAGWLCLTGFASHYLGPIAWAGGVGLGLLCAGGLRMLAGVAWVGLGEAPPRDWWTGKGPPGMEGEP